MKALVLSFFLFIFAVVVCNYYRNGSKENNNN